MTLLIIDDEPIIQRGLTRMVTQSGDYFRTILQAENARDALKMIDSNQTIDVIFADINLPDMNGLDLVATIKDHYPQTLIVIISGYDDFTYARQAIHLGVFDYLLKPVAQSDILELIKRLAHHLNEKASLIHTNLNYSTNELCNRAANYLAQHYRKNNLSLSMVAAALFVDPSYLSKQMKHYLGKSFNDYLATLRIDKAKELLNLQPIYSIQEIGERVGYPSQHYFSRVFKQHTDVSPSQYRQQRKEPT